MADYDLIVVGGGINGAGIARDAARRGMKVLLLERDDWGAGTSSRSSMLAHGGLRYLEQFELGLVREALREREQIFRDAPHLVQPLRFVYPLYPDTSNRRTVRLGMWLYDVLSRKKSVPKRRYLKTREVLQLVPGLEPKQLRGGATYFDGQFLHVERFVLELVLDAQAHGAVCRNHTSVDALLVEGGRCVGVQAGAEDHHAPAVINAAGPWVDDLLSGQTPARKPLLRRTKGAHVAVTRFCDEALILRAMDGRTFFVIPWHNVCLLGTTDTDFDDDPKHAKASTDDVSYLVQSTARYFPGANLEPLWTYAGVRPLINQDGLTESNVTRRHALHDHAADEVAGLWSVQGGKLTTYRSLAQHCVDTVCKASGRKRACASKHPLPGAPLVDWSMYERESVATAIKDFGLPEAVARNLVQTYGSRWRQVAALDNSTRRIGKGPRVWAQVDFAVQHEMAATLSDVLLRRLGPKAGLFGPKDARRVAARMQELLGWSDRETKQQVRFFAEAAAMFDVPSGNSSSTPHQ